MSILVFKNLRKFKAYLKKVDVKHGYIYFEEKNGEIDKYLDKSLLEKVDFNNYSENLKEEFFRTYIDLIGRIGAELDSIYWWASFTASKNRFISKLLPSLLSYYVICDKLKTDPAKNLILISTQSQIISSLKQYCKDNHIKFGVFDNFSVNSYLEFKKAVTYFLRIIYFISENWRRVFFAKLYFKKEFEKDIIKQGYYVLRTWAYSSSISVDNKFSDPFFGSLSKFLKVKKIKFMVLAGIINNYKATAKGLSKCKDNLVITEEYFLKYFDIIRAALKVFFNKVKLKNKAIFYGLDVSRIVQSELDKDYVLYMRKGILQEYIVINMLRYFKISTFTLTYENNPWEKIIFQTLRKYSPLTKIIGYQHAVITKASANMFVSREEMSVMPMPDKVITVGEITKDIMERFGSYPRNKIYSSCALRQEYIYGLTRKDFSRGNVLLVALEGVPECYKLVNFVFAALCGNGNYKVVIRTHPERSFDKIKKDLQFDINQYNNFSVSIKKTLKDDLINADILIYCGSTVSLEALMMGIPVIHVNLGDIISVDPLFECSHLKWTVKYAEELEKVILKIYSLSEKDYLEQYGLARSYIESYLRKVTDDRLQEFII